MKPILEIQNISKKFRIRHETQPYLSLRDSFTSLLKPNKSSFEDFYALQDINFNVSAGQSIGIIGRNGAGKSTLLKILSKITPPSSGKIISRGRIASLLEVGTGFHPELSGTENVFLNGSILGMKRIEIQRNFDAIIDFAGVGKFVDTPLKHYSSGMQLRLAFSVAAFLENEILVLDEVLAVGDAEFQKKCIGKMDDISKKQGKTILFVSHQMGIVNQLCDTAILLEKGEIKFAGKTHDVITAYNESALKSNSLYSLQHEPKNKDIYITTARMVNSSNKTSLTFAYNEHYKLHITFKIKNFIKNCVIGFNVKDKYGQIIFTSQIELDNYPLTFNTNQEIHALVSFPAELLTPGQYSILAALHIPNIRVVDTVSDLCVFNITDTGSVFSMYEGTDYGCVFAKCEWQLTND